MRYRTLITAIAFAPLACAVAHAGAPNAGAPDKLAPSAPEARDQLWRNAPLSTAVKTKVTQGQFADAATSQISILAELRAWRGTLSGDGPKARRELLKSELLGANASLNVGRVAPPAMIGGAGAGVTANWGALEIGSTLRSRDLDETMSEFDRTLTGEKSTAAPAQDVTWLHAKPLAGKGGDLELNIARAAREVAPGTQRAGTFAGAGGRLQLPMRWQLNGTWTQAKMDDESEKGAWNATLGGPIVHPLGEARAQIEWRETEAGYTTLSQTDRDGGSVGAANLTQEIKTARVTGKVKLAANRRARRNLESVKSGDALENRDAQGAADLQLVVTPNLSVRAGGTLGAAQTKRAGDEFAAALQAPVVDENGDVESAPVSIEETQTQGGDVGVEWKLSGALSVGASVGSSQTLGWRDDPNASDWVSTGQSAENRVGFEVRHRDSAGSLSAKYATRARDGLSLSEWHRLETLRLQAERPLLMGLRLKATLDLARDGESASWADESNVARRVEAQLLLSRAARVDLKWRDGAALPNSWLADPLSAPFRPTGGAGFSTGDREWGARFNAGSAASGNGLGLALEYARQERAGNENDQWRVGLTWK